ncbi:hypothetical protein PPTG_20458, partial [Phytophthora nicotianae INRA-310]
SSKFLNDKKKKLQAFKNTTNANDSMAKSYLEKFSWDLMRAVDEFYANGGESLTPVHLHDWQHDINEIFSNSSEASEVQVRDAMLNHLTDIERFTESGDTSSLVAITGMTGLPFTPDPAAQNLSDLTAGASQEIRPAEEIATSSQTSTHENVHENTIK